MSKYPQPGLGMPWEVSCSLPELCNCLPIGYSTGQRKLCATFQFQLFRGSLNSKGTRHPAVSCSTMPASCSLLHRASRGWDHTAWKPQQFTVPKPPFASVKIPLECLQNRSSQISPCSGTRRAVASSAEHNSSTTTAAQLQFVAFIIDRRADWTLSRFLN